MFISYVETQGLLTIKALPKDVKRCKHKCAQNVTVPFKKCFSSVSLPSPSRGLAAPLSSRPQTDPHFPTTTPRSHKQYSLVTQLLKKVIPLSKIIILSHFSQCFDRKLSLRINFTFVSLILVYFRSQVLVYSFVECTLSKD